MSILVGFQGRKGSFTFQALKQYMTGSSNRYRGQGYDTFDAVVRAFDNGEVSEMFLGTENNNSGCVHAMALLLPRMNGAIIGEHILHVQQCLLVKPNVNQSGIKEVLSQRPALDQCQIQIKQEGWVTREYDDTALAASFVSKSVRNDLAAIASPEAGEIYGLRNLGNIADNPENYTRFFHIGPRAFFKRYMPDVSEKGCITTIIVEGPLLNPVNHRIIADNGITISRLERIPNGSFQPLHFIIDLQAHLQTENCHKILTDLRRAGLRVHVSGCYRMHARPV